MLHDRTLVRRLVLDDRRPVVVAAQGWHQDRPDEPIDYRAKTFVVASGYCWSSHLLLLSSHSRFPDGLANSSGLVGRYMNGHAFIQATAEHRRPDVSGSEHDPQPDLAASSSAARPIDRSSVTIRASGRARRGRDPRLRTPEGRLLLGDELMDDWRSRTRGSSVRLRAYVDVHPSADSRLTLDLSKKNRYGDPMPRIEHHFDDATLARQAATKAHVLGVFDRLAAGEQRPDRQHQRRRLPRSSRRRLPDGRRSDDQRLRQLRPHPRSREPLRRRRADDADWRLHQRHAHLRRPDAEIRRGNHPQRGALADERINRREGFSRANEVSIAHPAGSRAADRRSIPTMDSPPLRHKGRPARDCRRYN